MALDHTRQRTGENHVGVLFDLVIPCVLKDTGHFWVSLGDVGELIQDNDQPLLEGGALNFIEGRFPGGVTEGGIDARAGV